MVSPNHCVYRLIYDYALFTYGFPVCPVWDHHVLIYYVGRRPVKLESSQELEQFDATTLALLGHQFDVTRHRGADAISSQVTIERR